jgi:hypothetical protein
MEEFTTPPERSILADRELLERITRWHATATHPLVRAAYEADMKYLQGQIDQYEQSFFLAHGI